MSVFSYLKRKWDNWYNHDIDEEADDDWDDFQDETGARRPDNYFEDPDQRAVYVLECLGQMAEASDKLDQCDAEYQAVTSLLMDMEEIENMPGEVRMDVMNIAQRIDNLEKERRRIYSKTMQMTDKEIDCMERLADEIPTGIKKMRDAEEYRRLIKHDLKKLENERHAYKIRKHDLTEIVTNSRGIAAICAGALVLCIILLLFLQFGYGMDVKIGYILSIGIGAVTITIIYIRYLDAVVELKKLSKSINRLITVHNTVKIRYINNTNLLQYLYLKYDVDDSSVLEERWNVYAEEMGARRKDEKLKAELDINYDRLVGLLSESGIKDPDIWIHQTKALYDSKETVEVRHALIARRQKLREQMEYNKSVARDAKNSISGLARKYPEYRQEISATVSRYESKKQDI